MFQEYDSSKLRGDQGALLRKCDDMQSLLGAKQEECALAVMRAAQLQEQLHSSGKMQASLQV